MPAYYDVVLLLIPLFLLGMGGSLTVIGLPMTTAIPIAALPTVALIAHAMFVKAPVDVEARRPPRNDSFSQ